MPGKVHLPTYATAAEERAYAEAARVRALMVSPQYRDPARRDPAVVAEVEGFFRRHYPGTVEPRRGPGGA
jgi:hypothetical protein